MLAIKMASSSANSCGGGGAIFTPKRKITLEHFFLVHGTELRNKACSLLWGFLPIFAKMAVSSGGREAAGQWREIQNRVSLISHVCTMGILHVGLLALYLIILRLKS